MVYLLADKAKSISKIDEFFYHHTKNAGSFGLTRNSETNKSKFEIYYYIYDHILVSNLILSKNVKDFITNIFIDYLLIAGKNLKFKEFIALKRKINKLFKKAKCGYKNIKVYSLARFFCKLFYTLNLNLLLFLSNKSSK